MKKTNKIILLITCIMLLAVNVVLGYTVELDPERLISFPMRITNGEGTISIDDSQTNYQLYYQAVEISNSDYDQINKIDEDGKKELSEIETQINSLKAEAENLRTIYEEKLEEYKTIKDTDADESQIEAAKTAYEGALEDYNSKVAEYNAKVAEYNAKVEEINSSIKVLIPEFIEGKWIETADGSFKIDRTQFSGKKAFAVWVKLICSDGTIYYDQAIYTTNGTKVEEVKVEAITLDKTEISIKEGSSYSLTATITPSDATNKTVIWSSSDESVATVINGKVTGVSEGTATITATTSDGNHTAICKVTVTEKDVSSSTNEDDSTSKNELPAAGTISYIVAFAAIGLVAFGIIMYKKAQYWDFK